MSQIFDSKHLVIIQPSDLYQLPYLGNPYYQYQIIIGDSKTLLESLFKLYKPL